MGTDERRLSSGVSSSGDSSASANRHGWTPLHHAAADGNKELVQALLADPSYKPFDADAEGRLPLHIAAEAGHTDICNILLSKNNAMLSIRDAAGQTPLFYATRGGQHEAILLLVGCKADIKTTDRDGRTSLFFVRPDGQLIAKTLLVMSSDAGHLDNHGQTPLFCAARNGDHATVRMLIQKQANVYAEDADGLTCLHYAVCGQHLEVVKTLVSEGKAWPLDASGAPVKRTFAANLQGEIAQYLEETAIGASTAAGIRRSPPAASERGSPVKVVRRLPSPPAIAQRQLAARPSEVSLSDLNNELLQAVQRSRCERVEELIEAKADPLMRLTNSQNLAFYAAARQVPLGPNGEKSRRLLELLTDRHGVDPAALDTYGQTPLFYAAKQGDAESCEYLISRKCDVNHIDCWFQSAIFWATKFGHTACTKLLLEQNASVNLIDKHHETPLFFAARSGEARVLTLLSNNRADIHHMSCLGRTALFHAGHAACTNWFLKAGVEPDRRDKNGCTAVFLAAERGSAQQVRALAAQKANLSVKCNAGTTCLFLAAKNDHAEVCRLLVEELSVDPFHTDRTGRTAKAMAEAWKQKNAAAALEAAEKKMLKAQQTAAKGPRTGEKGEKGEKGAAKRAPNTGPSASPGASPATMDQGQRVMMMERLFNAIRSGPGAEVKELLEAQVNPCDVKIPMNQNLVFIAAARCQDARLVCELLVEHRIDPTQVDTQMNQSPLFFAVRQYEKGAGGVECAKFLMSQSCDPHTTDMEHQTPLFYAAQRSTADCVDALVEYGAEVDHADSKGQTALFFASKTGELQPLQALLSAKADVGKVDCAEMTALFHASSKEVVDMLLAYRADVTHRNTHGQTALFNAAFTGPEGMLRALVTARGDVNAEDHFSATCLFNAAQAGATDRCRFLIEEAGASAYHRNKEGLCAADKVPPDYGLCRQLLTKLAHSPSAGHPVALSLSSPTRKRRAPSPDGEPIRRPFVLKFDDLNGIPILPGSPEYQRALTKLIELLPQLGGWDESVPLYDGAWPET
eukprot:gnl/TRDRNA2_/TRDRNA2_130453_c0_seq1.p1 gnl/TRDRNA2_/TRDRNA2_130453_c0~~gnl/TRDRNA2_/TRDRNA2_130453_c0_seq1.p1  ORF type:complete len:1052 (+),score=206.10 gnl/TRDRNA2_/TRDRNA2_130453_c0_seq1:78-3158(+)